jgi:hypothetical protein
VEEWKSGRVEEWKSGRVEEWKSGRVEEWKSGRVEEWKSGRVDEMNLFTFSHSHLCQIWPLKVRYRHFPMSKPIKERTYSLQGTLCNFIE